jgi:hypothetical protein
LNTVHTETVVLMFVGINCSMVILQVIIVESILSSRKFAIKALYRVPSYVSKGKNKLVKVKNLSPVSRIK